MTTKSSIGSKTRPSEMFSTLKRSHTVSAKSKADGCGCGSGSNCSSNGGPGCGSSSCGCRAKALTRLNRQGMAACQHGDFDGAHRLLSEGIGLASSAGVSMYEAKLRNNLGLVHLLASKPDAAAQEFGQALALVEDKLGKENTLYRRIEGNLSRACSL
ncbi:MAG: tetratricopeptide repeat protein [Acidobacteriota bacterium]